MASREVEHYYTVAEAAEVIGKSRQNVYQLIRNGHLEAIVRGKRDIRVSETHIDNYLKGRKYATHKTQ